MSGKIHLLCVLPLILFFITSCSSTKPPAPAPGAFPTGAFANFAWSWEFKTDGSFVSSGPPGSETGTYAVNGDRVVITCQCCGPVDGTYSWAYDGKALKFTAQEDACTNRKQVLDGSTWMKKP